MIRVLFSILFVMSLNLQAQSFLINPYWFAEVAAAAALTANSKSIDLDGSAEYVNVADDNSLSFTNDSITIAGWANMDDATSFVIAEKEGEYLFWVNASNKLEARFIDSDGDYIGRTYNTSITNDQLKWHHYAATFDGTTIDIYRDGIVVDDTDANNLTFTSMSNTANNLTLGYDGSNYADGKLDQVVISGNPFSIEEIKELMAIRDQNYHSQTLVSWWEFDNDTTGTDGITDLIGTNHGTMQSGEYADLNDCITWPYDYQLNTLPDVYDNLTPMQSGFNDSIFGGTSWDLDGSAEYIAFGDILDTELLGDYTVSVWVFLDGNASLFYTILAKRDASYNDETSPIILGIDNRAGKTMRLWWHVGDGVAGLPDGLNTGLSSSYDNFITQNQWTHITVKMEADTGYIYKNGELFGSETYSGTRQQNDATLDISYYDPSGEYLNGKITDVAIFNRALSDAEILALANNHSPTNAVSIDSLQAYWRPYNSTNVTNGILDQSGNGLNGTPTATEDADFQYLYPRAVLDSAGSFDLDGTAEYISVSDDNTLSFTNDSIMISGWANMDDATSFVIAEKEGEYLFWVNASDKLEARFIDAEGDYIGRTYNTGITNDQLKWNHYVATFDGTTVNIYRNGVEVDDTDANSGTYGSMTNTANALTLGYDGTNYADGKLSHISIGSNPSILCEIQELYNDGSPVDITAVTFSADIVSHWKIDQTDDPTGTVTDIVGSNNGTATSMEAGDLITTNYPTN